MALTGVVVLGRRLEWCYRKKSQINAAMTTSTRTELNGTNPYGAFKLIRRGEFNSKITVVVVVSILVTMISHIYTLYEIKIGLFLWVTINRRKHSIT